MDDDHDHMGDEKEIVSKTCSPIPLQKFHGKDLLGIEDKLIFSVYNKHRYREPSNTFRSKLSCIKYVYDAE